MNKKESDRLYYLKNKEKIKEKVKLWKLNNKEKTKKYMENYQLENKDQLKITAHNYYLRNREKYLNMSIDYYYKNKKEINKKIIKRKNNNPQLKILDNLRNRLRLALKHQKTNKNNHMLELLGCSKEKLKNYLEEQWQPNMSWGNYGKWHIDHIVPCVAFNLIEEEEQKRCFHYTNLQPLWAKDNLSKGCKI